MLPQNGYLEHSPSKKYFEKLLQKLPYLVKKNSWNKIALQWAEVSHSVKMSKWSSEKGTGGTALRF